MLAIGRGPGIPSQVAAILLLGPGPIDAQPDGVGLAAEIAARAARVRRLGQRLRRLPAGLGRPIWLDDPTFDPAQHVRTVRCPEPRDEQALLAAAAGVICEPLPPDRPLWAATVITGLSAPGTAAVLVVLDHVVADGVSAIDILGQLVDRDPDPSRSPGRAPSAPRPTNELPPSRCSLAFDALHAHLTAVAGVPGIPGRLWTSVAAIGGLHPPAAVRCSLLARSGDGRRLAVARIGVAALHDAAARRGGSVNDAVLAAVTGALRTLLEHRGEQISTLRVAVPVARAGRVRRSALGNAVATVVIGIATGGSVGERLPGVTMAVQAARAEVVAASTTAFSGPLFRVLVRSGVYRRYLDHQHRFHTLISTVRGPVGSLLFAGRVVTGIIPISVAESGNTTVNVVGLSYAGTLTVTVVADLLQTPDLPILSRALQQELDSLLVASAQ